MSVYTEGIPIRIEGILKKPNSTITCKSL
jgi:hypothetical protein